MLFEKGVYKHSKINFLHRIMILSPVKSWEQRKVINEIFQISGSYFQRVIVTLFFLFCIGNTIPQSFHIRFNGRQRRPEIMGNPCQKLFFCLLIFFSFLYGIFQILGHLIKLLTCLSKLVLFPAVNTVCKIAVLHLPHTFRQLFQGLVHTAAQPAGQDKYADGDSHRESSHKNPEDWNKIPDYLGIWGIAHIILAESEDTQGGIFRRIGTFYCGAAPIRDCKAGKIFVLSSGNGRDLLLRTFRQIRRDELIAVIYLIIVSNIAQFPYHCSKGVILPPDFFFQQCLAVNAPALTFVVFIFVPVIIIPLVIVPLVVFVGITGRIIHFFHRLISQNLILIII